MRSSDRGRGAGASGRHESLPTAGTESPANSVPDTRPAWLERMQRTRPRHAAITRNLHTWSSYKSWAEQVRDSWESDTAELAPKAAKK
jgi:3-oxoacyl-[acyl-carrier-protein] synthase III